MSEHESAMDQLVRQEEAIESLQMQLCEAVESANRMKERAESAEDERDQFSARVEVLEGEIALCSGSCRVDRAARQPQDETSRDALIDRIVENDPRPYVYGPDEPGSLHGLLDRLDDIHGSDVMQHAVDYLDEKPREPVCKHCGGAGRSPIQAGVSRRMESCPRCLPRRHTPTEAVPTHRCRR